MLLGAQQVNPVPSNCRVQATADRTMAKQSVIASTESGQRASSQSGHTHQKLQISENNDLNAELAAAQDATAVGSTQPASPDSVNAGQPGKAPAQAAAPAATDTSPADASACQPSPVHSSPAPTEGDSAGQAMHDMQQQQAQADLQDLRATQQLQAAPQQQQDSQDLEVLGPLPPPDATEGPDALAEYELYLERWDAGDTLRQRWQRLKSKGLLTDIQAEWEDWQHDLLLDTIQLQLSNAGGLAAAAAATRQRRSRAEMEGGCANGIASASAGGLSQEPRRVRTRRAPASFQEFHVEAPVTGSPDRTDINISSAAAADVQRRMLAVQQYSQHNGSEQSGWDARTRGAPDGQRQQAQVQPTPRQSNLGRPQLLQRKGPQGGEVVSEEFIQKFRSTIELVRSSGNAVGMEGAAALLADPDALKAFVSALSQHTDNPAAAMHRLAATLAAQATQH